MNGLAVDGIEIDPLTAAAEGDHQALQAFELPVGNGDPVSDAGAPQLFPLEQDVDHGPGREAPVIAAQDLRQLRQDRSLGDRIQFLDDVVPVEQVGDLHGKVSPIQLLASSSAKLPSSRR